MNEKFLGYEKVLSYLSVKQFAEALKIMMLWNNEQLATFLLHNPKTLQIVRIEEFDDFWLERLDALRLPTEKDFRFMEQPGIKNADFVSGYLLFLLESKFKSTGDDKKSFKFNELISFHSVRRNLHLVYLELGKATEADLKKLTEVLYNLEAFAKLHGTPGYLLLAYGYMQSALGWQKSGSNDLCQAAFKLCWKYLSLAKLAEEDSKASINNAYFGKGFILATPFKLATISEMKAKCLNAAGLLLLPLSEQTGAERAAEFMYSKVPKFNSQEHSVSARP